MTWPDEREKKKEVVIEVEGNSDILSQIIKVEPPDQLPAEAQSQLFK